MSRDRPHPGAAHLARRAGQAPRRGGHRSLEDLTRQVDCVRGLKTKLTHIGSTAREVADALDLLRAGVLRSVKDLESQLAVVEADAGTSLTARFIARAWR